MNLTGDFLRKEIVQAAALVEKALALTCDPQVKLENIFKLEAQINVYHTSIDDNIFKYIALKTPAASNLRLALSAMKINSELERIGDQAVSVKRSFSRINRSAPQIEEMRDLVTSMLRECIDSFVHARIRSAAEVIQRDFIVNEFYREVVEETLIKMKNSSIDFNEGFAIIRVAKGFERMGDLTTNICEAVIFMVCGADIRHRPDLKVKDAPEKTLSNITNFLKSSQEDNVQ